jgi:hypothetical protein
MVIFIMFFSFTIQQKFSPGLSQHLPEFASLVEEASHNNRTGAGPCQIFRFFGSCLRFLPGLRGHTASRPATSSRRIQPYLPNFAALPFTAGIGAANEMKDDMDLQDLTTQSTATRLYEAASR